MHNGPLRSSLELATASEVRSGHVIDVGVSERRAGLALLHQSCARAVFGYVWRRTGDRHLAEDLTSEAFVRAFERLGDLAPSRATRAWLLRVASNLVNRWARRRQLLGWLSLDEREHDVVAGGDNHRDSALDEGLQALRDALLRLPPRFQCVLALRYVEGIDVDEVARILELPLGTVHSRLSRGRERLRRELQRTSKP